MNSKITLFFLAGLTAIVFVSCLSERNFYKKYSNNTKMGIRTPAISEVLLNATGHEILKCERGCDALKEQFGVYKKWYQTYAQKAQDSGPIGPICPCSNTSSKSKPEGKEIRNVFVERGYEYATLSDSTCIWNASALEKFVVDVPISEFRIENSKREVLFSANCPQNLLGSSGKFLSFIEVPGINDWKDEKMVDVVVRRNQGKKIVEKRMKVCTSCAR